MLNQDILVASITNRDNNFKKYKYYEFLDNGKNYLVSVENLDNVQFCCLITKGGDERWFEDFDLKIRFLNSFTESMIKEVKIEDNGELTDITPKSNIKDLTNDEQVLTTIYKIQYGYNDKQAKDFYNKVQAHLKNATNLEPGCEE